MAQPSSAADTAPDSTRLPKEQPAELKCSFGVGAAGNAQYLEFSGTPSYGIKSASLSYNWFTDCNGPNTSISVELEILQNGKATFSRPADIKLAAARSEVAARYECDGPKCGGTYAVKAYMTIVALPTRSWTKVPSGCNAADLVLICTLHSNDVELDTISPVGRIAERFGRGSKIPLSKDQVNLLTEDCLLLTFNADIEVATRNQLCLTEPIFVSGSDVLEAAITNIDALTWGEFTGDQKAHPNWVRLTYSKQSPVVDQWYKKKSILRPERCQGANTGGDTGKDCDEFPFRSTSNAGGLPEALGTAAIRPVDSTINQDEGRALGAFYKRAGLKTNQSFLAIPAVNWDRTSQGIPTTSIVGNGAVTSLP